MARATECPPATASVVDASSHAVGRRRPGSSAGPPAPPHREPMSIYEVHLGSWRQGLGYRQLADELVEYVTELGFTHVELLPVAEHPFGGSWGYQVTSYYAPTSRFGTPDDFRYLVDRLHQAGIGVIVDWVPGALPAGTSGRWPASTARRCTSTPTRAAASSRTGARSSSTSAAARCATSWSPTRSTGSRSSTSTACGSTPWPRCSTWTTRARTASGCPTVYGGRENLDAVAFLQEMNATVYKRVPGVVTIAEESTAWPGVTRPTHLGGLGFGFKWNMGWMHDSLDYMGREPVHRQYHHNEMTFSMIYAWSENFVLPHLARRGGARQGLAAAQDARRPLAAAGQPARLPGVHVGAPGQAAAVHGRRVRPGVGVVARPRSRLVAARPPRPPRRPAAGRAT